MCVDLCASTAGTPRVNARTHWYTPATYRSLDGCFQPTSLPFPLPSVGNTTRTFAVRPRMVSSYELKNETALYHSFPYHAVAHVTPLHAVAEEFNTVAKL